MELIGKCHLCERSGLGIFYCRLCGHYFCVPCAKEWRKRTAAAVLERLRGKKAGCCGPTSRLEAPGP